MKQTSHCYEFGPFRMDTDERLLTRDGAPVSLTPKAFEVLHTLVENGGRVVAKEVLMERVWSDRCIEESNITQTVFVLRRLLGTDEDGRHHIETVPTRGYRFVTRVRKGAGCGERAGAGGPAGEAARGRNPIESLAVLPLANESGLPDLEYLCDGISETLINALSRCPGLLVMARNTVFRHKGQDTDARLVGRSLGVQAVLIGHVIVSGGQLVIGAEVVDVSDGSQVWGARLVRECSNIITLVEEVAEEIFGALRLKLTQEERTILARRYTEDVEAYHLFLKGRYLWGKRSTEGMARAVEYFEQAISLDPNYAPSYVGLADSYNVLRTSGALPPRVASSRIRGALQRALEIDDSLAEAHASMGHFKTSFEWDWSAAEGEFRRALELNPDCVTAHHWYSLYLRALGRIDESLATIRRAQRLAPLSSSVSAGLVATYYYARHYERAMAAGREALELNPDLLNAHALLGMTYSEMGRHAEAVAQILELTSICDEPEAWALLGYCYGMAGQRGEARKILEHLRSRRGYVAPFYLTLVHTGLGEHDAAFDYLERAYRSRDGDLTLVKVDPRVDRLRPDARFARLLERLGLSG